MILSQKENHQSDQPGKENVAYQNEGWFFNTSSSHMGVEAKKDEPGPWAPQHHARDHSDTCTCTGLLMDYAQMRDGMKVQEVCRTSVLAYMLSSLKISSTTNGVSLSTVTRMNSETRDLVRQAWLRYSQLNLFDQWASHDSTGLIS